MRILALANTISKLLSMNKTININIMNSKFNAIMVPKERVWFLMSAPIVYPRKQYQ